MTIFDLLSEHRHVLPLENCWKFSDTQVSIGNDTKEYVAVSESDMRLFGVDILSKLKTEDTSNTNTFDAYFTFLRDIRENITRVNHIGFGYLTNDVAAELALFKKNLSDEWEILEEDSGDIAHNRWFFMKHKTDRSMLTIELVLYSSDKYQVYFPQFQIDIDTDLPFDVIEEKATRTFGKDFFFWKYDIANYGVVMAMGQIGYIDGIKILFGIGTNLRKQQEFVR